VSRLPGRTDLSECAIEGAITRSMAHPPGWAARLRARLPRAGPRPGRPAAIAALAVAAAIVVAGCAGGGIAQNTPASNGQSFVSGSTGTTVFKAGTGPVAPSVTGTALGGAKLSLTAYHGRVVVVNFWGSWCTPCRSEAPALAQLDRKFRAAGVQFLGVDIRDSPASAEAFMRDFGIQYPSLNDPGDEIALDFRSTVPPAGIPTTLVIARSGRIAARVIGEASYNGLNALIAQAAKTS
jgi:thiol-disulfide isomerase/thioredoxin